MRELRVWGLVSETYSLMPEVSKVSREAREGLIVWQMGSVRSNMCWNINSI